LSQDLRPVALSIDRERARVARDIHDGISQMLTAVLLDLELCERMLEADPTSARTYLRRAGESARRSLSHVRQHILELRSGNVDNRPLVPAFEHYLSEAGRLRDLAIELTVSGEEPELPPQIKRALFLIVHESVVNLHRHSGVARGEVRLIFELGACSAEVVDRGRGFEAGAEDTGYGLRGMRERADEVGIELTVESRPGVGTTVRGRWESEREGGREEEPRTRA
jgi:signal transduction histidine kinase